jgi:hypothetical protein
VSARMRICTYLLPRALRVYRILAIVTDATGSTGVPMSPRHANIIFPLEEWHAEVGFLCHIIVVLFFWGNSELINLRSNSVHKFPSLHLLPNACSLVFSRVTVLAGVRGCLLYMILIGVSLMICDVDRFSYTHYPFVCVFFRKCLLRSFAFVFLFFGDRVLLCSSSWPGTCYVTQAGFKLSILPPQPLECRDYRCASPCVTLLMLLCGKFSMPKG